MREVTIRLGRQHRRQGLDPPHDVLCVEAREAAPGKRLQGLPDLCDNRLRRTLHLDRPQSEDRGFTGTQVREACNDDGGGHDQRRAAQAQPACPRSIGSPGFASGPLHGG